MGLEIFSSLSSVFEYYPPPFFQEEEDNVWRPMKKESTNKN